MRNCTREVYNPNQNERPNSNNLNKQKFMKNSNSQPAFLHPYPTPQHQQQYQLQQNMMTMMQNVPRTPPNSYQNTFYLDNFTNATAPNLSNITENSFRVRNGNNNQQNRRTHKNSQSGNGNGSTTISQYDPYWDQSIVEIALKTKQLIKSKLRINQRNFKDAFLSDPNDSLNSDIYIESVRDRNRALNGDIVAAKLKQKFNWKIVDQFMAKVEWNWPSNFIINFKFHLFLFLKDC